MKESEEIKIRLLNGPSRSWLSLSGTILTYRGQSWGREERIDIPLELITVSTRKRLVGTRLIIALLSLLLGPALGGAGTGICFLLRGDVPESVLAICMATGSLIGVVLFFVMLIRFFISQHTFILNVADGKAVLEFWVTREDGPALGRLLQEITNRVSTIRDKIDYPIRTAVGDVVQQPWKRTVALTWLCAIPGLIIENPWLLLLCVIPLCWHSYSALTSLKNPRAFRWAVKSYLKQNWGDAQEYIDSLIKEHPGFLPAHLMRVDLLCRDGRFDDSEKALSTIQDHLDVETLRSIQEDLILRRRVWERKQEASNKGVVLTGDPLRGSPAAHP